MENQTSIDDQNVQFPEQGVPDQLPTKIVEEKPKVNYWKITTIVLLSVLISGTFGVFILKNKLNKQNSQQSTSENLVSPALSDSPVKKEALLISKFYPFSFKFKMPENWDINNKEIKLPSGKDFLIELKPPIYSTMLTDNISANDEKNKLLSQSKQNPNGVTYLVRNYAGLGFEYVELLIFSKNTKLFHYSIQVVPKSDEEREYFLARFQEIADSLIELSITDGSINTKNFWVGGTQFKMPTFMQKNPINDENYDFISDEPGLNIPSDKYNNYIHCNDPLQQQEDCIEGTEPPYGLKVTIISASQTTDLQKVAEAELETEYKKYGGKPELPHLFLTTVTDKINGKDIVADFPLIGNHVIVFYQEGGKVFRIDAAYPDLDFILSILPL